MLIIVGFVGESNLELCDSELHAVEKLSPGYFLFLCMNLALLMKVVI